MMRLLNTLDVALLIIGHVVTTIVAVAAAIDALLPQPVAGSRWVQVRHVVALLAINKANATNAVQPGTRSAAVTVKAGGIEQVQIIEPTVEPIVPPLAPIPPPMPPEMIDQIKHLLKQHAQASEPATPAIEPAPPAQPSSMPEPAASPAAEPSASAPGGSGASKGRDPMNILASVETFFGSVFATKNQQAVAQTVESDLTAFAAKAGMALTIIGMAVAVAGAEGGLKGQELSTVESYMTKAQQTLGAFSSASTATDYESLISDFAAVGQALPIGTNDKAHVAAVVSGLQLLIAGTSAASATLNGQPAPAAAPATAS